MKTIITVSRQFSSGGRQVGKRLADALQYAYYDKEIVGEIAKQTGFAQEYIEKYSEKSVTRVYPYTYGATFYGYKDSPVEEIQKAQFEIITKLAQKGECVIVGRCADYILREQNPLKVFIYASDMACKIERCKNKKDDDGLNEKEIVKQISRIDKERAKYYYFCTGQKWGELENYNLFIDTSAIDIKTAVEIITTAASD